MIQPIFQTENYQVAKKLLDAAVLRQEAISSNISNAETPGFRRIDVAPDFMTQLQATVKTQGVHSGALDGITPKLAVDPNARATRPDGNTVEIETELLRMNENNVEHDFLVDLVSRSIKQLKMAISGRTSG